MRVGSGKALSSLQTSSRGFDASSVEQVTSRPVFLEDLKASLKLSLP